MPKCLIATMTDERWQDADEGLHFGPVSRSNFATST